jgi:hypothetical protein
VESFSATSLIVGIITSALGLAYIAYGKRQTKFVALLSGVALCAYSFFVDSWLWLCVIGALLLIAPFIIDV